MMSRRKISKRKPHFFMIQKQWWKIDAEGDLAIGELTFWTGARTRELTPYILAELKKRRGGKEI